jgi:fumarate hydratase class II
MSQDSRIEKDSLGEVRVPAGALYGAQTQRAVENFPISGHRFGRRMIEALGIVKRAAAETNRELGSVDATRTNAIVQAANEVVGGKWDGEFVIDIYQTGSGTSSNMNANEVIAARANQILGAAGSPGSASRVHQNDHVNFGQSSNDVIPTAIHIAARLGIEREVIPALKGLAATFESKAEEFDDIVKSGRTHLMDATPVRLGQEFGGYAAQVRKGIARLERASEELAELPLGGTATGTGINTHPEFPAKTIARISKDTGLRFTEAANHFEAQGARDALVEAHGSLNTVAVSLLKIADDVRWLASGPTSGIAEIRLPAVQPGSSIMPGKVNPVLAEALMMVCARVAGNQTTMTLAGGRGNFELNVMMPVMCAAFVESVTLLANAARAFDDKCVRGIEANRERAKALLERNPAIATALNLYVGYDRATEVAKRSALESRSVRDIVLEIGLIPPDKVDEALDVRGMTEPGLRGGGEGGG